MNHCAIDSPYSNPQIFNSKFLKNLLNDLNSLRTFDSKAWRTREKICNLRKFGKLGHFKSTHNLGPHSRTDSNQFHFNCWENLEVVYHRKVYPKISCFPNNLDTSKQMQRFNNVIDDSIMYIFVKMLLIF